MKRSTGNEGARARFRKSTLGAVARSVRDWLDELLREPEAQNESEPDAVEDALNGDGATVSENNGIARIRNPFEPAPPPEAWVKMAQEYAPRLLVLPEHGGTQWQHAPGIDEETSSTIPELATYPASVEVPERSETHPGATQKLTDESPDRPISKTAQQDARKPGLLGITRKLSQQANEEVAAQSSRKSTRISTGVSGLPTEPKRAEFHDVENQPHVGRRESSQFGQVPAQKEPPFTARMERLRDKVWSSLRRVAMNRGGRQSQRAKLQLITADLSTGLVKPVLAAHPVRPVLDAKNRISRLPIQSSFRVPQELTQPTSQSRLLGAVRERVTVRPPTKSQPISWPSLKSPAQNYSDHAGMASVEAKQKEPAGIAEPRESQSASSAWWSTAATDHRWPELPVHSLPARDTALLLRNAERQLALDLEQRGGH